MQNAKCTIHNAQSKIVSIPNYELCIMNYKLIYSWEYSFKFLFVEFVFEFYFIFFVD